MSFLRSNEICNYNINTLMAACNLVFRYINTNVAIFDQNQFLYLSYQAFTPQHLNCDERIVRVEFYIGSNQTFHQFMIACPGSHNPVQTIPELDTYIDEIHISHGFQRNQAIIYKKIRMSNPEYNFHVPLSNIRLPWNNLIPMMQWPNVILNVMPNTLEFSYVENEYEVHVIYAAEINMTYV